MSIYDKASLVLIPSGTKTSKVYSQVPTNGDGDFTFSRSTAATRVNASGNIEKETQNIFLQSNTFSTSWTLSAASITSGHSGYDGTNNAWELIESATTAEHLIRQTPSFGGVVTLSVYAKANTRDWLWLRGVTSGVNIRAWFDLTNGVVGGTSGNVIDHNIESAGGGWYRCSLTLNHDAAFEYYIGLSNADGSAGYAGDGSSSIYIQDAQLEQGLVARDYIETTTTAIYGGITDNVPRLDYTDSSCPALLLEPQRTNAMTFSEGLNIGLGINYKSSGVTLTPNDAESPEGYNNATKFDGGLNDIADTYIGYTASTTNTFSAFLKAGTCDIAKMRHTATGSTAEITINLTSGTITNTTGAQYLDSSIVDYGNGWYRASITFTSGTTAYITRVQLGEAGYIHMYGWQIERGVSYATSYIPTYGSAVTRNVDRNLLSTIPVDTSNNYTIFMDLVRISDNEHTTKWFDLRGNDGTYIQAYMISGGGRFRIFFRGIVDGTQMLTDENNPQKDEQYKFAIVRTDSSLKLFANGALIGTKTDKIPDELDYYAELNENRINNHMLFPTALTDQEAIDLTTL